MRKKNTGAMVDFLYCALNAGLLSGAVLLCFSGFFGIQDVTWKHGIVFFLSIVLFSFVRELKKRQQLYALSVGILIPISLFLSAGRERSLAWIQAEKYLVWIFLAAAVICFLQLLLERFFVLKAVISLALGGWLLYALLTERQTPRLGVIFAVLYGILVTAEGVRMTRKETKKEKSHAFILGITPFLLLYACLLCLMPAPETPYSWRWVKELYARAEEKVTMCIENLVNRNAEDMETAVSGFSEDAGLFSGVAAGDRRMMNIKVSGGKKMSLYLAGKVYDSFDGREWTSRNRGGERERLLDTVETGYALERYSDSAPDSDEADLYRNMQMEAEYRFFHTDYLLAPSKTWETAGKEKRAICHPDGADLVFDKKAGYGTEYQVRFCQINMDEEKLRDFLLSELREDESAWKRTMKEYPDETIAPGDLFAYAESVRELYLKETEISPGVKEWLSAVTKDAASDVEKLCRIEKALADMEYNTKPGKLPETVTDEESFLTYFLLEKREGYCAYFATAFVLLARAEGFPARYVQGFCVPIENGKETAVYSDMAHAWPEVYIDGKGWIPFEPTPGYGEKRYQSWEENAGIKYSFVNAKEEASQEEISAETEAPCELSGENMEEEKGQSRWLLYIVRIVLLLSAAGILAFAADRIGERHREKGRRIDEKFRIAVLLNLQILSMLGYEREKSETYHELAERIKRGAAGGEEMPVSFIETYERALYGTLEVGEQELEECFRQRERLLETLKKEKGNRYFLCRAKLYLMRDLPFVFANPVDHAP